MTQWNVYLECAHALPFDRLEDLLLHGLAPYSASISGSDGFATSSIRMTVEAETAAGALERAWQAVTQLEPIMPAEVLHIEIQTQAAMEAALELP